MKKPILCLDFDGVCHSYTSGWKGADVIPDPHVPGLFEFIEEACRVFDVQVFSSRSGQPGGREAMAAWFVRERKRWRESGGKGSEILEVSFPSEKPPALVTIDDRAVTFAGEWPSVEALASFTPWNKRPRAGRRNDEKPIPDPLYSCATCSDGAVWPACELYWSEPIHGWVCDQCWTEIDEHWENDKLVEAEISLASYIAQRGQRE